MPREIRRVLNIAHRGASASAPENTAEAFEQAIAAHADMIEFDLRKTSDGVIVVYHDSHVEYPDGSKQAVSKVTYPELAEICSLAGFQLTTFERTLAEFGSRIALNVEIKICGFEREVVKMINAAALPYRPVVSSFKPEIIRRVKSLDSSITIGLVIGSGISRAVRLLTKPLIRNLFAGVEYDSIHLHKDLASADVMDALLDSGFSVYVWTVNEPDEIETLIADGASGIISDVPHIVDRISRGMAKGTKAIAGKSVREQT